MQCTAFLLDGGGTKLDAVLDSKIVAPAVAPPRAHGS